MNQEPYHHLYNQQPHYQNGGYCPQQNFQQVQSFAMQDNLQGACVGEAKVEYTEFENLSNYPPNTDMMAVFQQIRVDFENPDWTRNFAAIDSLRTFNKYYPNEINGLFANYGGYIHTALGSIKPYIAKNILVFVIEILQSAKTSGLDRQIPVALIPILVQKTGTGNKSLQTIAEKALQVIVFNCLCDEVIQAFCVNSATKNKTANKKSFFYLAASIDAIKENISQLNSETLKIIFQCMAYALLSDCAENKTYAKQILGYVRNLMGNDNFFAYVTQLFQSGCVTMAQGEALVKAVEIKGQRKSLAEALKEAKAMEPYQMQKSTPNLGYGQGHGF
jgi:hypothetical protein